jgi:TetR/AcrR family transcriptional regulator
VARPKSDIDTRIVAAARARFLVEGVEGASLRSIAQDAGTNVGMIYYYFPTKDDLFLGVVEDVYAGLLDDLTKGLSDDKPVEERFRAVYHRMAAMTDVEFDVLRIVIREALVSSARLEKVIERFMRGHVPFLLKALHDGTQDGTLRTDTPLPATAAALATCAIFPQIMRRRLAASGLGIAAAIVPDADKLAEAMFKTVFDGVRASSRST